MARNCSLRPYWRENLAKTNKTSIVTVYFEGKLVPRVASQHVYFYLYALCIKPKAIQVELIIGVKPHITEGVDLSIKSD